MTTTIVVLDGRDDPFAREVTQSIAEALVVSDEEGDAPRPSTVSPSAENEIIHGASTAVVLDDGSLVRAREAGVPFVVAVLPGFDLSWSGELRDADHVVVAHDVLVEPIVRRGVPRTRISVGGVIAPKGYAPAEDRAAPRQSEELDADVPVVLVPSALLDLEGPDALLVQLSLVDGPVQFVFDVGVDAEHADILRERTRAHGLQAWMFAEEPGSIARWQLADAVVGRVGGYEVSRALAVGAPLVLVPARRSAGIAADALESVGVAREADVLATLAVAIEAAIEPAALEEGRRAVAALAVTASAQRLSEIVRDAARRQQAASRQEPRGLPHGLEAIGGERPPPRSSRPAGREPLSDLDARIERELAELKKKLE